MLVYKKYSSEIIWRNCTALELRPIAPPAVTRFQEEKKIFISDVGILIIRNVRSLKIRWFVYTVWEIGPISSRII